MQPSLDAARQLMDDGIPVVLLGDYNAPSHRDWIDDTVGARPHLTQPFEWPTSVASEEVGLVDAYRSVFPDPVTHPGLTWPAERPFVEGYNPAADGHAEDRIDLMYVSPDITVETIRIVGEAESQYSDLSVSPWPTDHRGLLADLRVPAVPCPTLVSASRRLVALGDDVDVRALGIGVDSVVVVPRDADACAVVFEIPMADTERWSLATEFVGAGRFDVVARAVDRTELARTALWVAGPGDVASIVTSDNLYTVGQPINVHWSWAPGNRADWVGVYPADASVADRRPLMQFPTHASIEGSGAFSETSHRRSWPLKAGDYTVHLLMDDLRISLSSAHFTVDA
jgi:hypothetical protein